MKGRERSHITPIQTSNANREDKRDRRLLMTRVSLSELKHINRRSTQRQRFSDFSMGFLKTIKKLEHRLKELEQ